ncbi:MAG: EutN/CcmL family microcompartment protein [Oscillospiraceae bacterium]|nr:EutN/CcmL family microcompartment protein [Oscillospiraceae bacterium]MCL2277792.1 EutN/CcmL family microcompartment protein [Oscillospiraceae bacterium]
MRIAKVVGNVVSTVKDESFSGHKLMIVENESGSREIAFDVADAGVGDTVLVVADGGASNMVLGDRDIVADITICGVIDHYTIDYK